MTTLTCDALLDTVDEADSIPYKKPRGLRRKPRAKMPQLTVDLIKPRTVTTVAGPVTVTYIWQRCHGGVLRLTECVS
jgi:hypothetical protein